MNKDNYKKAIDSIHAKESLKTDTFEKIIAKKQTKYSYIKYITAIFSTGIIYINKDKLNLEEKRPDIQIAEVKDDLPRFENIEQLKAILKENYNSVRELNGEVMMDTVKSEATSSEQKESYSTTNVQVENVDEADIVKTDGKYIYYVSNGKIYIVKANDLTIASKIEIKSENERFYPIEIYINQNKLIVLGNSYNYEKETTSNKIGDIFEDVARVNTNNMAKAIVYDISNKEDIKQTRIVALDGNYTQSRMIGDNIYFISNKIPNYYKNIEDDNILPIYKDTAIDENTKKIECSDIVYFDGTESYNYMLVAGFNINNNNPVNTETFFGAGSTVYASENNLYIAQSYWSDDHKNTIYKFNLKDSQIKLKCKGEVEGYLNNQFSIDEYEGNLRIATTSGYDENSNNQLYILDENLNQIGKIDNLAKGEKIYSVRFIGKVGYIVTFKQIDPLFVIDLSNPTKPIVKGQLKIPGYSSYLHPYDETHIIGIGYNTKSNGYGGITNDNMKMSMFDVSDLQNPKEMFNVNIGDKYTYSQITSNHKALFYNKDKQIIGFPVTYSNKNNKYINSLVLFKIDLEKGFEKYGEIKQDINYKTDIDRAIYIGDKLYTLSNLQITQYDFNTINKINEVKLDENT